VLCGVAGSGKSTFAARHFLPTEIVSSDQCRAMISDDPTNQRVSGSAFKLMHWIAAERLRFRRTTVVDSTALDRRFRREMLKLAADNGAATVLILFDVGEETSLRRDSAREHAVGPEVIERQYPKFIKALEDVRGEPWGNIALLTLDTLDSATVVRPRGKFDRRYLNGPFDIVGDVHGCLDELLDLLDKLGYRREAGDRMAHPDGRTLIFLGDLADRGPHNAATFALVMSLVERSGAMYTPGNHCNKLLRYLRGNKVSPDSGLEGTIADVDTREQAEPGFRERLRRFIESAPTYLWLDDGDLVVAHGGIKEDMIGRDDSKVRAMVLYGDVTGRMNPDGTPERLDWAAEYDGQAAIVYGHSPVPGPEWRHGTINIDQGCVFGGWLTALGWPERQVVQVRAREAYYTGRTPDFVRESPQ
jgi:protein phosphatase